MLEFLAILVLSFVGMCVTVWIGRTLVPYKEPPVRDLIDKLIADLETKYKHHNDKVQSKDTLLAQYDAGCRDTYFDVITKLTELRQKI